MFALQQPEMLQPAETGLPVLLYGSVIPSAIAGETLKPELGSWKVSEGGMDFKYR